MAGVLLPDNTGETLTYSGDGQRRSRSTASESVQYLWDEENVLEELDAGGNLIAHYSDFAGYGGGLTSVRSAASSFYLFDLQASTRYLLDGSGNVSDSEIFEAFGQRLAASGTTRNPRRFHGQAGPFTDVANRVWMGHRIYDPLTGRWYSPDPISFDGMDWNLYRFVGNNPTNSVDAYGLQPNRSYDPKRFPNGPPTRTWPEAPKNPWIKPPGIKFGQNESWDPTMTDDSFLGFTDIFGQSFFGPSWLRRSPTVREGVRIHERVHRDQTSSRWWSRNMWPWLRERDAYTKEKSWLTATMNRKWPNWSTDQKKYKTYESNDDFSECEMRLLEIDSEMP